MINCLLHTAISKSCLVVFSMDNSLLFAGHVPTWIIQLFAYELCWLWWWCSWLFLVVSCDIFRGNTTETSIDVQHRHKLAHIIMSALTAIRICHWKWRWHQAITEPSWLRSAQKTKSNDSNNIYYCFNWINLKAYGVFVCAYWHRYLSNLSFHNKIPNCLKWQMCALH